MKRTILRITQVVVVGMWALHGSWMAHADPIVINQNPQPVTRYAGEAFTLNVTLTSGSSPQYQWWQGGTTMIPGATNSSLTLNAATGTAGSYTVVISNSENVVTSTPPAVVTVYPVTSITTALSSHWTFDETSGTTAADSTANALTATLNNFPGDTTTWVPGQIGGALAFDGASQQYANVTGFVQATNTLTLSAWVWASTRTDRMSIVDSYGQNPIGQFRFGVSSAALRPLTGLVVQQSGTAAGNPDVNPIPVGVWEHVALVADGTTVRLYLNGTQVATAAYNGTIKNPSGVANMFIGARIADDGVSLNATKGYWTGMMDDLGMWTRGLTSAEILAIYAAGYMGHQDLTQADAYKPAPPFITAQPQGTTAYAGASQYLRLSVSASGTQPLSYQWWRGSSPVAGATNATYLVNGVTTNDAGSYTVVVSDVVSAVTSTPPAVVTVITPPATGYSSAVVADVPEGYWRMDDSNTTLVDMMGRHNGTYLGSTYVQGQPGGIFGDTNTCADFEAGTDYASVPYSPFINGLGNPDSFSLELWVTSHAPGSGGTCPIQIKGLNGVNGINIIAVEDSSAYMQTAYANNGSWGSIPVTGGAVKNDGVTWQHIAITFDRAASTMSIYVNGVLAGSATANYGPACSLGTDLQIGAGGGTPWMGQVDEVAWYNKALSADRVLAHYVLGTATVAPTITTQPQDTTAYASASFVLSVSASGTPPLRYQWWHASSPVPGATNATYRVDGVTTTNAGSYTVVVRNVAGAVTSTPPAVVTVLTPPTSGYLGTVIADAPEGYWRMDDITTTLVDVMGRHNGTYQGASYTQGQPGGIFGGTDTCVNFEAGTDYASVPYSTDLNGLGNTNSFSFELWVTSHAPGGGGTCPIQIRAGGGINGINIIEVVGGSPSFMQTAYGKNNGGAWGAIPVSGGAVPNDGVTWQHIVVTYDKPANTMKLYLNGALQGSDTSANYSPAPTTGTPLTIGAGGGTPWIGQVNEVAWYNKALSQDRILAHYNLGLYGDAAPIGILTEPQSQTVVVGMPAQISVEPNGLPPFHYQWAKNSAPIAGQTNQTLSLASAYFTDSGNYSVTVTNLAGSTNSAVAVLTVIAQPSFAQVTNGLVVHLPFDGDYNDYSGRGNSATPQGAPTFVPGIIGSQAIEYSTATGSSKYNYVSLLDTNYMNGTWPDLLFGSSTWSAAFWVKLTGGVNTLPFLGNNNGGTYANNNTGCAFGADTGNGGGLRIAYGAGYYWSETNALVADGNWHHIAVLSGPIYVNMYVDGQQVYSAAGNIALPYVGTYDVGFPFNIGQDGTGALAVDGTGMVDDLGIWNRRLTPLEIYSLFEVGKTYGRSLDQVAPVKLNLQQLGTNLDLSWQAGTLLYSTNVTTGYIPVPGATAPFYRTTASGKQCFYRVQQ